VSVIRERHMEKVLPDGTVRGNKETYQRNTWEARL
jgi:hypothetical protein